MTAIIGHRGASGYALENTLAAFTQAVALGADGIELDIHATADDALLVHHDPDIRGRPIAGTTAQVLRSAPLANGEPVPTLADALGTIGTGVDVYIEIKALPARLDAALFAVMDAAPAPDRCHVHAFDHRLIRRLTTARPALSAGVLSTSYPLDPVPPVRAAGANTLWQHKDLVDAPLVALAHEAGIRVIAWTVDRPADATALAALGVDALCTNLPDRMREALA